MQVVDVDDGGSSADSLCGAASGQDGTGRGHRYRRLTALLRSSLSLTHSHYVLPLRVSSRSTAPLLSTLLLRQFDWDSFTVNGTAKCPPPGFFNRHPIVYHV